MQIRAVCFLVSLAFGIPPPALALQTSVDIHDGMGSPIYPARKQKRELNKSSELKPPEQYRLANGNLNRMLPWNELALIEITHWK